MPERASSTAPTHSSHSRVKPKLAIHPSSNTRDRYPRPESGLSTTTRPSGPACLATRMAAATAIPPEPPMRMPSVSETRRAVRKLSSSLMAMTSS